MGYTYDSFIPREKYDKMSVTEKQQALLQGVIVEEAVLSEADLEFTDQEIPFEIKRGRDAV